MRPETLPKIYTILRLVVPVIELDVLKSERVC